MQVFFLSVQQFAQSSTVALFFISHKYQSTTTAASISVLNLMIAGTPTWSWPGGTTN
jgi:hypothetical protein